MASSIRLSFLGGATEIGASSLLIEVADRALLVDCGVRFRTGNPLPDLDPLTGRRLDAVLVTHAHSDHTGALPVVHDAFPETPIYLSPPTLDLVRILQRDALKLMDMASEREGELPLYGEKQVEHMLAASVPIHHGDPVTFGDIEVTWLPASHILGASMIHLATPAGHVLVTGDYSIEAQRTVPALSRPAQPVDLLITESTYGNRLHADRGAAENRLVARVQEVLLAGGRVLIPAFAIGRAQEVLLILKRALRNGQLPPVPVFADGMVRAVCDVYARHVRYVARGLGHDIMRARHPFFDDHIRRVEGVDGRREVLEAGPCVIVASSGMLAGGPSAFYAAALAACPQDAIFITGYQDEESPGHALLRLANQEADRSLRLGDTVVKVRCAFESYNLSAHADRLQMIGLAEALSPRTVVMVHGDAEAKQALAKGMRCHDVQVAEDGAQLDRRFPVRRAWRAPPPVEIDADAARALLGSTRGAVRIDKLALAWFGRKVDEATRERFVLKLEALGVAHRDDERRMFIWPEAVSSPEEEAVEQALKEENPKGRILELCMRMHVKPPVVQLEPRGHGYEVELTIQMPDSIQSEPLSSGVHHGSSKKLAEQLAARALLDMIVERTADATEVEVDETTAVTLKRDNPKGRLLEYCARHKTPAPVIEVSAVPGGNVAEGRWHVGGVPVTTRRHRAAKARIAEQAAAAELLAHASRSAPLPIAEPTQTPSEAAPNPPERPRRVPDARMRLNELRQLKVVSDFGYTELDQRGPAHQPAFVLRAWADLGPGRRLHGEPVEAVAKKRAQSLAAASLLQLIEHDIASDADDNQ